MGKAYLLAIFLLAASFSGCLDSSDNSGEKIVQDWDFFPIDGLDHEFIQGGGNQVALGVANLGNQAANFTVYLEVYDFKIKGLGANSTELKELLWQSWQISEDSAVGSGFGRWLHFDEYSGGGEQVSFSLEPGQVQILILEHEHNFSRNNFADALFGDEPSENLTIQFHMSAHMPSYNNSNYEVYQEKNFTFNFTYVERGERVEIGDTAHIHFAGFLEKNGRLFDTSIEEVWDNYDYFMEGTTSANRHTATLPADNIGCNGEGDSSENCDGGRQMIRGFDQGMVGMYVNQTIYVVIPPEDAYGKTGSSDLAGETLIFFIRIVSVE